MFRFWIYQYYGKLDATQINYFERIEVCIVRYQYVMDITSDVRRS